MTSSNLTLVRRSFGSALSGQGLSLLRLFNQHLRQLTSARNVNRYGQFALIGSLEAQN